MPSRALVAAIMSALCAAAAGCSEDGPPDTPAAGVGGTAVPPPTAGVGGTAAPSASTGGTPVLATGGTGGTPAPVGGAGGTGGAGGVDTSGAGQAGGDAAGTGGAAPALDAGVATPDAGPPPAQAASPSAGCSLSTGRPAGGVVEMTDSHYFTFPESYDGSEPFPVLMGFHGCASVNRGTSKDDTEWMRLTNGTAFETEYVRAVPLSQDAGGCWSYDTDVVRVKQVYDALLADHCVDEDRVFAAGHSSGAQFIVQLLLDSHVADAQHFDFEAVVPFAASDYGPMTGPIPVMYVQGMMDAERGYGDGHETVERFRAANGCGATSMPYPVAGCQSGATTVTPGCVSYDGCQAPTLWCSHDDPAYSGTMHGIPCFGMTAMYAFLESLM